MTRDSHHDRDGDDGRGDRLPPREPLFRRTHQKASLSRWIVLLVLILAAIFLLPRLAGLLFPGQ